MRSSISPWVLIHARTLSTAGTHSGSGSLIGPAVRLLLQHYHIKETNIKSTGPKSNILKSDVLSFISAGNLKPILEDVAPPKKTESFTGGTGGKSASSSVKPLQETDNFIDIPLSNIRSAIAKRLTLSKQTIPHNYMSESINMDAVLDLRSKLKRDGITLSVNDFIIKSVASALEMVPEIAVQYKGENVVRVNSIDISVAVATSTGLITPIVFNANHLGLKQIADTVRELSDKAKNNKLQPNEFLGGTFTISNLGMFEISNFTAIVNPPQCAILAVGRTETVLNDNLDKTAKMNVTLCFDNRAISDTDAKRFLTYLSAYLSDPDSMLSQATIYDYSALL